MIEKLNFTQIPNIILDELLIDMTKAELKVILVICRKTIGWHKETDAVSYSQFEKLTGLGRQAIATAITLLQEKGLIIADKAHKATTKYTLDFENHTQENSLEYDNQTPTGMIITPESAQSGMIIKHTKESIKENKDISKADQSPPPKPDKLQTDTTDCFKHWCNLHRAAGLGGYNGKPAPIQELLQINELSPEKIKQHMTAWYNEHKKPGQARFYALRLEAFSKGYSRVSSEASGGRYDEVKGWPPG